MRGLFALLPDLVKEPSAAVAAFDTAADNLHGTTTALNRVSNEAFVQ